MSKIDDYRAARQQLTDIYHFVDRPDAIAAIGSLIIVRRDRLPADWPSSIFPAVEAWIHDLFTPKNASLANSLKLALAHEAEAQYAAALAAAQTEVDGETQELKAPAPAVGSGVEDSKLQ